MNKEDSTKPLEFWIQTGDGPWEVARYFLKGYPSDSQIHVIEYRAYQNLMQERVQLIGANEYLDNQLEQITLDRDHLKAVLENFDHSKRNCIECKYLFKRLDGTPHSCKFLEREFSSMQFTTTIHPEKFNCSEWTSGKDDSK